MISPTSSSASTSAAAAASTQQPTSSSFEHKTGFKIVDLEDRMRKLERSMDAFLQNKNLLGDQNKSKKQKK